MSDTPAGNLKWILIPGILTLAVTVVRLVGELQGMDPALFGVEPGGTATPAIPGEAAPMPSLVGIFWLMPIVGAYFALRLRRSGDSPAHRGKALLFALLGAALFGGSAAAGLYALGPEVNNAAFPWFLVVLALVGILAMLVCRAGWPSLFRLTFTYGLLARVPIVILTYILCFEAAGTHYEKVAPMAPTDLTTLARATWLSVAQIGVWVPLTVLFGGLAGALTAFIIPRKQV